MYCVAYLLLLATIINADSTQNNVVVSLQAQWNHTSLIAEAGEFIAEEGSSLYWKFVELLTEDTLDSVSPVDEYNCAIRNAEKILEPQRIPLLKHSLALRVYSPRVRVFQQLGSAQSHSCASFVDFGGKIICDAKELDGNANELIPSTLYKFDHVYQNSQQTAPAAVLYAELGSAQFSQFHKILTRLHTNGYLTYVYRPFSQTTTLGPVGLSGYGAELAIKSTEYKAVDDARAGQDVNLTSTNVHGVNFDVLSKLYPDQEKELKQLLRNLNDRDELTPLKQWEVSDLSFQAAYTVASTEVEHVWPQLVDLSQNFPIRARELVNVLVPEVFRKEVIENQAKLGEEFGISEGDNVLLINGINVEVEQLDEFQLFDIIRAEDRLASMFYNMGFRREYLSLLFQRHFNDHSATHALDYRNAHPIYLNNLDKDNQYRDWGNSVKALLQPTYMGMLRPIARNFFTLIFVVDPADPQTKTLLSISYSLFLHKVPIRIGFVFVVNDSRDVSGLTDTGVALLNVFNFVKDDTNSVPKAAAFLKKVLESLPTEAKPSDVHSIFKKHYKHTDINDVFQADSDYDVGRTAGTSFVRRSALGSAPKVLLNGILLDDSMLSSEKIEEAILMQIMRQTTVLQHAVVTGKLRDNDNVQNWIMNQPDVLPRLNRRILEASSEVLSFGADDCRSGEFRILFAACSTNEVDDVVGLNLEQQNDCVMKRVTYFVRDASVKKYYVTLWVVADLNTEKGRLVALNGLRFVKKTKYSRLAIIHSGDISPVSNFIMAIVKSQSSDVAQAILTKKLSDASWLESATKDTTKLTELQLKKFDLNLFKKSLASVDSLLQVEHAFGKRMAGNNQALVVSNGEVYGPIDGDEDFEVEDFLLLEQLTRKRGATEMMKTIEEWGVVSDKLSDVFAKLWSAFSKFGSAKGRKQLSVSSDSESVIYMLAGDNKRGVLDVTVVVDPLSKGAQKLSAVVSNLVQIVNCDVRIILNPKNKLSELPLKRFYRHSLPVELAFDRDGNVVSSVLEFSELPSKQLLTLNVVPPESWMVQPLVAEYDLDNLKMENVSDGGVSDRLKVGKDGVQAVFELVHILLEGHCIDVDSGSPPRGLQFILQTVHDSTVFDTIVMANLGYFQLKASPGAFILKLREGKSSAKYSIYNHTNTESEQGAQDVNVVIDSFLGKVVRIRVGKKRDADGNVIASDDVEQSTGEEDESSIWSSISNKLTGGEKHEQINVFSLASGHLYERFLRIMIVSVMKNTKHPVKFWLLNNYLSPQFRSSLPQMASHYGFDFELVEYKWPRWLHQQTEKQRIMWGYKILFLDVLFPLDVRKIIFVDADQIVRTDLMELMNFDLDGAPYGYTPFCDSRTEMEGFRFWKKGYWANHLAGRRYHISALYVVDLAKFRQIAAGDRLRGQYQGLSADPNSLSNLDQDLPNNMIHQVRIKSLPQEWLWCETWCSDASKAQAKTIDLCNNPETKEPKLESAMRIIPEWTEYDQEIKQILGQQQQQQQEPALNEQHSEL